ncbi:hypothetical protein H1C71_003911, partial [Ictidomys tridecemlineatus]
VDSRQGSGRGGPGSGQPGRPREDAGSRSGARGRSGRGAGSGLPRSRGGRGLGAPSRSGRRGRTPACPSAPPRTCHLWLGLPQSRPLPRNPDRPPPGLCGLQSKCVPRSRTGVPRQTAPSRRHRGHRPGSPWVPPAPSGAGSAVGVTHPSPTSCRPTEGPRVSPVNHSLRKGKARVTPGDPWEPAMEADPAAFAPVVRGQPRKQEVTSAAGKESETRRADRRTPTRSRTPALIQSLNGYFCQVCLRKKKKK